MPGTNYQLGPFPNNTSVQITIIDEATGCEFTFGSIFTENCEIFGCTDATATNFDPMATVDDGSCSFAPIMGCTDATATNFNPMATVDDGSCTFEGCTDPTADNFDPNANSDNGSCIFLGCTDPLATNFDPNSNSDDGSCVFCEIINTPIDIQEDTDPGLASTSVSWPGPNLTSGCLTSVLICDSNPGDSFGIGTTKVAWRFETD